MTVQFNFHELKTSDRLPSPSGTALAIMQLVEKADATLQEVAQLVKVDPALSGRILSFSNSAAFGARRPIANIQDAVMMMGMQTVRNFALSLSLISSDNNGHHCANFNYAAYWSQSLAIGVALAAITARESTVTPEESFTLGLLSDIGSLALATAWSEVYSECLARVQGDQLLALERERFAIDHNDLSLMLLADWGLPRVFIDALSMSFGNGPKEPSRTARFAKQLVFARMLGQYCLADENYRAALLPDIENESSQHGLEKISLLKFIDEVISTWHEWGRLIDINTEISQPGPAPDDVGGSFPGLDLLLVDDDPLMIARLSKQLQEAGHRVAVCRDGENALKYVFEYNPQMVITDWHMKPVDGLTLCKNLRTSTVWKHGYIIMLTASEDEDALVAAFDAGIDDYVTKPVSLRVLLARIRAGQRLVALQKGIDEERRENQRFTRELAAANRRLEMMANTDILTGLPNRRYALGRLAQEWETAQRFKRPLSVLMLDLDHFKSVNDTLGHEAGDEVLAHAAKVIREAARTSDIACRLGGEEFLVIATNTDGATAVLLGERIRKAIEHNQPVGLNLLRPITVSIGISGSGNIKKSWNELIKMADSALYKVKQGTRNSVKLATI